MPDVPLTTIPLPLHGPISEFRMITLDEPLTVTQSPVVEVIFRLSMMVPFCALRIMGPEGNCATEQRGRMIVTMMVAVNQRSRKSEKNRCTDLANRNPPGAGCVLFQIKIGPWHTG